MRQHVYDYARRANAVDGGPKGVSDALHREILGAGKDLYRAVKRRLFGEKKPQATFDPKIFQGYSGDVPTK